MWGPWMELLSVGIIGRKKVTRIVELRWMNRNGVLSRAEAMASAVMN